MGNCFGQLELKRFAILSITVGLLLSPFFLTKSSAADTVPRRLNYQGRLMDSSDNLLTGTYYLCFSIWDNATVGLGSQVWPASTPTPTTITTSNGIFSAEVGSADALNLDFDAYDYYLQVYVNSTSSCSSGGETLSPRQHLTSSAYSINADMLDGLDAATSGTNEHIVATDSSGNIVSSAQIMVGSVASAPTALGGGSLYYNSTDGNLYGYDGVASAWVDLTGGGGSTLWTDVGAITYLTATTDDVALGGTDSGSPFYLDVSEGDLSIGGDLSMTTGDWVGLGSSAGRMVFTDTATDTIGFMSGNVGIGTTSPNALLHVGSTGTPGSIDGTDDAYIYDDLEVDGTIYGDIQGTITPGFTEGSVVFTDSSGSLTEDNSNFFWDDTNNRLGIGTTSPTYSLDILAQTNVTDLFRIRDDSSNNILGITDTQATFNVPTSFNTAGDVEIAYNLEFTNDTASYIRSLSPLYIEAGDPNSAEDLVLRTRGTGDVVVGSGTTYFRNNGDVEVKSGSDSRLFVDASTGNVGIGTTSPDYLLHLYGTNERISIEDSVVGTNTAVFGFDGSDLFISRGATGGEDDILIQSDGDVILANNGNVGIGTTGPVSDLDIYSGDGNSSLTIRSGTTSWMHLYQPYNLGELRISVGGGEVGSSDLVTFKGGGNVGIGTAAPGAKLEVNGSIFLNNGVADGSNLVLASSGYSNWNLDNYSGALRMFYGSTEKFRFYNNGGLSIGDSYAATTAPDDGLILAGNVGIGTAGPSQKLDITGGNLEITGTTVTGQIADTFADTTTQQSYIHFPQISGSNDPGYIMHETSDSETNEGVLHLAPSDDNSYGDYVSIHGTNDPDMIKLHTSGDVEGVNTIGISTSAERIDFDASNNQIEIMGGNVGIGTASPGQKLDVAGNVTANLYYDRNNTGYYGSFSDNSRLNTAQLNYLGVGTGADSTYRIYATGAAYGIRAHGSTMGGRFQDSGGTSTTYAAYGGWGIYTGQKGYFGGNVGIGDSSPDAKLDVEGTVYATAYGRDAHNEGHLVGSYNSVGANSSKSNPIYTIGSNYNPTDSGLNNMYGIGYTHTYASFITDPGPDSWGLYVAGDGDARDFIAATAGGSSYFNAGNVGIGTASPNRPLHVYTSDSSYSPFHIQVGSRNWYFGPGDSYADNYIRLSSDGDNNINMDFAAHDFYASNNVNALSFTDRTPYPDSLDTAIRAVFSMKRLPDGEYEPDNKDHQLDHSKLDPFIQSQTSYDGKIYRDLSASVSVDNEVIKKIFSDLYKKEDGIFVNQALKKKEDIIVTNINGGIENGNYIKNSIIPNVGELATKAGAVVGKALESTEDWNEANCPVVDSLDAIQWPEDDGTNQNHPCFRVPVSSLSEPTKTDIKNEYGLTDSDEFYVGKIMVFVNVSWYEPEEYLSKIDQIISDYDDGLLTGSVASIPSDLVVDSIQAQIGTFTQLSGETLSIGNGELEIDALGNLVTTGNLSAVNITGENLFANSLEVQELVAKVESDLEIRLAEDKDFILNNSEGDEVFRITNTGKLIFAEQRDEEDNILSNSVGEGIIESGETEVLVANDLITMESKVFVSSKIPLAQSIAVVEKYKDEEIEIMEKQEIDGKIVEVPKLITFTGFRAVIKNREKEDVAFDYWIVN